MIEIRNDTDEDYVIQFHVDPAAPGCRVLKAPQVSPLERHNTVTLMGYEPGVSITIRPVQNPDLPRATVW